MKLAIPMPRFLRRKQKFHRVFTRYDCQLDTSLMMIDRMISFEGRLLDISRGGAMYRPKLAYIMHRADTPVCMQLGSEELFGQIISTSDKGFSIRFDAPLDEEDLIELLEEAGVLPKVAA